MKVLHHCPTCKKVAETASEMKLGSLTIRTYKCGHSEGLVGVSASVEDTLNIISLDGKRPFAYQLEGGRFVEESNIRAVIADEMALGKTVQAIMVMIAHPEARPFATFVKSGLKIQWGKECVRWGDLIVQIIDDTKTDLLPGMDGYIISYDSAWRMGMKTVKTKVARKEKPEITYEPIPGKTLPEQLARRRVKTIILDECQQIKNTKSLRTKAIQNCARDIPHVIAMSGTPIKNNAAEYFTALNIVRPDKFPNESQFIHGWCDTYFDGYKSKTAGIRNPEAFAAFTKDFIIRRTRAEVLPDLPSIFRQFSFTELGDMVEDMYKQTVKEFQEFFGAGADEGGQAAFQMNILAYLSKMRHLTGLAKIEPVCEFAEEFIASTDRKLAIFVHHKDVGETLKMKLENMAKEWPAEWGQEILQLHSGLNSQERDEVIMKWSRPGYRICILSTLASGEGLNLQFCSDCIMMERQWNPANEEQCEARFPRPGQTADKINANYFVAVGTVDEFFSELVERKREIVSKTLDGKAVAWNETSMVKELAQILFEKGGKKWGF